MNGIKPANITANRITREFIIKWEDDETSQFSFSLLRHACPCAECRGGHDKMGSKPDPAIFDLADEDTPATHLVNIEAVGSYAITPYWEDGHHYGIYTWEYLRALDHK